MKAGRKNNSHRNIYCIVKIRSAANARSWPIADTQVRKLLACWGMTENEPQRSFSESNDLHLHEVTILPPVNKRLIDLQLK
jgi:hypothetical protein